MSRRQIAPGDGDPAHGTVNGYAHNGCRCFYCRKAYRLWNKDRIASRHPLAEDDPRHGSLNGYRNYNCRCDLCRAARKEYGNPGKALGPRDPRHGTKYGYDHFRCRCGPCKDARLAYDSSRTRREKAKA